jgi:hypothetical protein
MARVRREGEPGAVSGVRGFDDHQHKAKGTVMSEQKQSERARDKALEDSFPASDPPADTGITGADRASKPTDHRGIEELPTGLPTSDRHATETAHHSEDETMSQKERPADQKRKLK